MTRAELIRSSTITLRGTMRLSTPTGTQVAAVVFTVPPGASRDTIAQRARNECGALYRKTFGPINHDERDVVEQMTHTLGELAYEIRVLA